MAKGKVLEMSGLYLSDFWVGVGAIARDLESCVWASV